MFSSPSIPATSTGTEDVSAVCSETPGTSATAGSEAGEPVASDGISEQRSPEAISVFGADMPSSWTCSPAASFSNGIADTSAAVDAVSETPSSTGVCLSLSSESLSSLLSSLVAGLSSPSPTGESASAVHISDSFVSFVETTSWSTTLSSVPFVVGDSACPAHLEASSGLLPSSVVSLTVSGSRSSVPSAPDSVGMATASSAASP